MLLLYVFVSPVDSKNYGQIFCDSPCLFAGGRLCDALTVNMLAAPHSAKTTKKIQSGGVGGAEVVCRSQKQKARAVIRHKPVSQRAHAHIYA